MLDIDFANVADIIINQSMQLKEGDVLWIECGDHNLALAEECALAAGKIGASSLMTVTSDSYMKKMYERTPLEFLKKPCHYQGNLWKQVTALLHIEVPKDPALLNSIPPEKKAARRDAMHPAKQVLHEGNIKIALLLYPTPEMAKAYGVDWEFYHDRVWRSMMVPPQKLYKIGLPIREMINRGREVHITSEKGTNLRFSVEGRRGVICNGQELEENYAVCQYNLNIPSGEVFTAMVENSTEGTAVFDRVFVDGTPVENLRLDFKKGSVVNFGAEKNEKAFADFFRNTTPADRIAGEFGIGTNPEIHEVIGCLHTDEKIAGTIHIAIGANNMYGGKNKAPLHFDMIMSNPTVKIDGEVMMEKGKSVIGGR